MRFFEKPLKLLDTDPRAFTPIVGRISLPRIWLITVTVFVLSLYLLFLISNVYGMIVMHAATHAQVMTATSELPQSDFARFWFVGKSFDMGHAAPPHWFKKTFRIDILSPAAGNLIWLYPPTMNLVAMLIAKLPLSISFWTWRLICWVIAGILLRYAGLPWIVILAGILSPAGLRDTLGGQNGTLCGALVVSSLLVVDRHPRISGTLAGILCIKPQAAFIFPLILSQKRPAAFRSCVVMVTTMVGCSLLIEGTKPWIWFFTMAQPASRAILQTPFVECFPGDGFTVFVMARSLHASLGHAWLMQGLCSVGASIFVWQLWRTRPQNPIASMAATVSLATLITPYGFIYDLAGFGIAMAAMTFTAPMILKPGFAILWLASGYTLTVTNLTGLLLFPLAALLAAALSLFLIKQTTCKHHSSHCKGDGTLAVQ